MLSFRGTPLVYIFAIIWLLYGCGSNSTTGVNEAQVRAASGHLLTLTLLRESTGLATNTVSEAEPGLLIASITDAGGEPEEGLVVTFSSDGLAFDPASGTALSSSVGEADVLLIPGDELGAGAVTATAIIGEETVAVSINAVSVSSEEIEQEEVGDYNMTLGLTSDADGSNVIRADAPGTVTATITDVNGGAVPALLVEFSTELGSLDPANGKALTDDSGVATISLLAGDETGAEELTATAVIEGSTLERTLSYAINPPQIQLGNSSSGSFEDGALAIGVSPLSAGGTSSVALNVVDAEGELFVTPLDVTFDSSCAQDGDASIDATATTVDGAAQVTYRAQGCEGTDTIYASLSFGGSEFSATGSITVLADSVGSIEFIEASPTMISLSGTGGQSLSSTSTVTFEVRGSQGLVRPNESVNFELSTDVGGITLSPSTGLSDSDGQVSTVVQSGSVATSVRVKASLESNADIATQSDMLNITTGIPDTDSISLSLEQLNPESFAIDGVEVAATVSVADMFNNPAPDGTAVAFTTEGGFIQGACNTVDGACSVTWTSANPRPADGRVTILATALGHESFSDENGNGRFDDGDSFSDVAEAFRDDDLDGSRDSGEPFIDFDGDGSYDIADGLYNGPLCEHTSLCGSSELATVSAENELVMSSGVMTIAMEVNGVSTASGSAVNISGAPATISVTLSDVNGNSIPGGANVEVASSNGELGGTTSFTVSDFVRNPTQFVVTLVEDGTSDDGVFEISITTEAGSTAGATLSIQD